MDPVVHLRMLGLRWRLIVAIVLVGLAAGWVTTPKRPPPAQVIKEFTATNTLITTGATQGGTNNALNLAFLTTTGEVPQRVAIRLNYQDDPALLAAQVKATGNQQLGSIQIVATMSDGQRAAEVVNAFSEELRAYLEERQRQTQQRQVDDTMVLMQSIQNRIFEHDRAMASNPPNLDLVRAERDALVRQYGSVYDRLQQLQSLPPASSNLVELQRATPVPVFRTVGFRPPANRLVRTASGGAIGLVLGLGLALALGRLDTRIRSKESAESAFGLPVIAEIPSGPGGRRSYEILMAVRPTSPGAAAHRSLRASIALMKVLHPVTSTIGDSTDKEAALHGFLSYVPDAHADGRNLEVLLMTAPDAGEEKTAVAVNLAASFAELGKTVLFLAFDVSNPAVFRFLGVEPRDGIDRLLQEDETPELRSVAQETVLPRLWLSTVGSRTAGPVDLLTRSRTLIRHARSVADVVVVDTGPVLSRNEAAELVPAVDAVVIVCTEGRTPAEDAHRTGELLARLGAPVLGVVLTGRRRPPARHGRRVDRRVVAGSSVPPPAAEPLGTEAEPAETGAPGAVREAEPARKETEHLAGEGATAGAPATAAHPEPKPEAEPQPETEPQPHGLEPRVADITAPAADRHPPMTGAEKDPSPPAAGGVDADGSAAAAASNGRGPKQVTRKPRSQTAVAAKAGKPSSTGRNGSGPTNSRAKSADATAKVSPKRVAKPTATNADSGVQGKDGMVEPAWWPEEEPAP